MSNSLVNVNGTILPANEATVPACDRGLLYGDGLFETMHAYGSEIFRLDAHLNRLMEASKTLSLNELISKSKLHELCKETALANFNNGANESNIRLTVTRGTGPRGPGISGPFTPTILVSADAYIRPSKATWEKGANTVWASFRRQEAGILASLKTLNYLEQIMAKKEADAAGVEEAILLNNAGLLCEGSASNITLVKDGVLHAPDPQRCGALPGLSQETVFELAETLNIKVILGALCKADLEQADEAFISGSMREITPLVSVGDTKIGDGNPGKITRDLYAAYHKVVSAECGFSFGGT